MEQKKVNDSNSYYTQQNIMGDNQNPIGVMTKENSQIISKENKNKNINSNEIYSIKNVNTTNEKTKEEGTLTEKNKENNGIFDKIKKKYSIICLIIFLVTIIVIIIFLIGIFVFDWFYQKEDFVIQTKREENSVSRYLEIKNSTNSYFYEGNNENKIVQNYTIITDFIVAINKKIIIKNFGKIDYLYELFILIINITEINNTNSVYLGGINIYDDSKSIDDLINNNEDLFKNISLYDNNQEMVSQTELNVPISKFYFYENGTIDKIYFPQNISEFYKSAIIDLIEKVTPKISKSLYEGQKNRRRLNQKKEGKSFNYEQIIKNNKLYKTIFYEDNLVKNKDKKEFEDIIEKDEMNSKITRTFDSSGDLVSVEMEGEAIFRSGPPKSNKDINLRLIEEGEEKVSETNESYFNLGLDEFKINVTSNMKLSERKINPLTLFDLNKISQKLNIDGQEDSTDSLFTKKIKETNIKFSDTFDKNDTGNLTNQAQINKINYLSSYKSEYKIISLSFLGLNVGLQQYLYISNNTGLRKNYVNLIIDGKEYNISTIDIYQYYYSGAQSTTKKILDNSISKLNEDFKYFGLNIKASLDIEVKLIHGIEINVIDGEMNTKGFTNFDISLGGSLELDFDIISYGVELTGNIVQGDSYIQASTLLNINSEKTKFLYFKKLSSCSVDLNFYYSILWKEFKYSINIYKGISSNNSFYEYV